MFHAARPAHGNSDIDNCRNRKDARRLPDALDIIDAILETDEKSAFPQMWRNRRRGRFGIDRLHGQQNDGCPTDFANFSFCPQMDKLLKILALKIQAIALYGLDVMGPAD